jgi:hypothetical protein
LLEHRSLEPSNLISVPLGRIIVKITPFWSNTKRQQKFGSTCLNDSRWHMFLTPCDRDKGNKCYLIQNTRCCNQFVCYDNIVYLPFMVTIKENNSWNKWNVQKTIKNDMTCSWTAFISTLVQVTWIVSIYRMILVSKWLQIEAAVKCYFLNIFNSLFNMKFISYWTYKYILNIVQQVLILIAQSNSTNYNMYEYRLHVTQCTVVLIIILNMAYSMIRCTNKQ